MAFQAVPNGVKIELNALVNGIPNVNVWYAILDHSPGAGDLADISEAVVGWYDDMLQPTLSSQYVAQNVTVTDVSVADGVQAIASDFANAAGNVTSAAFAANAALGVSWRTAFTGRSFRGRTYFGGQPVIATVNAQSWSSSYVTGYIAIAQGLIDALAAVGATLSVVSRFAAGVARVTALATEIISIIVDNKVDSQRRRTAN